MDKNRKYFGIDFGTTCCAAVSYIVSKYRESGPVKCGENDRPVPSVVAIDEKSGQVYRGRLAKEKRNELDGNCKVFTAIKSVIDKEKDYYINGKKWTPVDIAGEIFKEIRANIENTLGLQSNSQDVIYATVAIPVGFNANQRKNIRLAAKKAEIEIASFISEPTAAFFANYKELKGEENIVIFDWGGGTLDITVVQNKNGEISELAAKGKNIAGDAIDDKLARRMHAIISRKNNINVNFDDLPAIDQDQMLVAVEKAKIALSDQDEAKIFLPYGNIVLDYNLFEAIIDPEITMAIDLLHETIAESKLGLENIDRIVLVGGSSNLRPLLIRLDEEYGEKLYCPFDTEWNVGDGAAQLNRNPGQYYSSQEIGIILSDENQCYFIEKGENITDWKKTFTFGITDTSKQARFIFCGSADIEHSISRYKSLDVPAYSFLHEKIIVTAEVDKDRIFRVRAKSSMKSDTESVVWEYPNLKCNYKLKD